VVDLLEGFQSRFHEGVLLFDAGRVKPAAEEQI
jgi:hypothetical protein